MFLKGRLVTHKSKQVLETDYNYGEVVHWPFLGRVNYYWVSNSSCHLMDCFCVLIVSFNLLTFNLVEGVPTHIKCCLISNAVEYSITTKDYKVVKFISYCELRNFRLSNKHALLSSVLRPLCFDVSESTRDRQPSWKHAMGTEKDLRTVTLWRLITLGLVDTASVLNNPCLFILFARPMVSWK